MPTETGTLRTEGLLRCIKHNVQRWLHTYHQYIAVHTSSIISDMFTMPLQTSASCSCAHRGCNDLHIDLLHTHQCRNIRTTHAYTHIANKGEHKTLKVSPSASMEAPTRLALPAGPLSSCIFRLHMPRAEVVGWGEGWGGVRARRGKEAINWAG